MRLKDYGFDIALLATDRSPQGKAMMAKPPWNTIRREFDVWHFVKSVVKKLHKKQEERLYRFTSMDSVKSNALVVECWYMLWRRDSSAGEMALCTTSHWE